MPMMMKNVLVLCIGLMTACHLLAQPEAIRQAMADYDYPQALQLIAQEEPTVSLLYLKGTALKELKRWPEALQVYEQLCIQDSLAPRAFIESAACCKALSRNKQAVDYYEKALQLDSLHIYARMQYIQLLQSLKRHEEALEESRKLVACDSSTVAFHQLGQCYQNLKRWEEALSCYQWIQRRDSSDYLAAAKQGMIYIEKEDYPRAIEVTEAYRRIDSTHVLVNQQNAQAYCLNQDYEMAIRRYESLLQQGDSTFYTTYYLGISFYASDLFYEACDAFLLARKQAPKDVNLLYYLGKACSKTRMRVKGVEYMEEAVSYTLPPDSAMNRLYIGLADCYQAAGLYLDQLETLETRYARYDCSNHKLLYDMAFISYRHLNNPRRAQRYLEAFLKTRPEGNTSKAQTTPQKGEVQLGDMIYYNAAEKWLEDLKKHRKREEFFQGKKQP